MDNVRPTRRRSYKTMTSRCVSALVCLAMAKGTQGSTVTRSWLDADSNSIDENTDRSTRWMENGPDYLFEGDMILTYKQLESNYGPDIANAERSAGHVILEDAQDDNGRSLGAIEEAQTWPGGIVYWGVIYQDEKLPIPPDDTDHNEQVFDEIAASCESVAEYLELNVGLEVKRVDRNNLPVNWIRVSSFSRNGCGSSVGMYSRVQSLNLGSSNCRRRGIATHEFLHALGMFHEHTNSNRDDYVVYHEDRVLVNKGSNFEKRLKSIDLGVPYDYNSIMHYTSVAFAIDFEFPTLTSVDEEAFPTSSIGSKNSLQGSDIVQLQAMYHCTKIRDRGGPVPTPESGETFGARSVQELCSPGCPCAEGQGHCRNNADCVTGLTCVSDFTTYYHLIPNAKKFMDFKLANGKGISVCREDPNAPLEPMTRPPKEGTPTPPPTFPPTKVPTNAPTKFPTKNPTTQFPTKSPTTKTPTKAPSEAPTRYPTDLPTRFPTVSPTHRPSRAPSETPSLSPTQVPTRSPTLLPTAAPSLMPTVFLTQFVSVSPTKSPTRTPTTRPTNEPTTNPTPNPTPFPTPNPSLPPTTNPTISPTRIPTNAPTMKPTIAPTRKPTKSPTRNPTNSPTPKPTNSPTTRKPTAKPTTNPTISPTRFPTNSPTIKPTTSPTIKPTISPTRFPTNSPTIKPTTSPTIKPTVSPTMTIDGPTSSPTTAIPTAHPTLFPTLEPITLTPTIAPTLSPTKFPTSLPTRHPTSSPSVSPTVSPTRYPTISPSKSPTSSPTVSPSTSPTSSPTASPSTAPTLSPTTSPSNSPSSSPTTYPTHSPSHSPTHSPTRGPTLSPTKSPTMITQAPTTPEPTSSPTVSPTGAPSTSPTRYPTSSPNTPAPTTTPTRSPTGAPSTSPTRYPTSSPNTPAPTTTPTRSPTGAPSTSPTRFPTASPSTLLPTSSPTLSPTGAPSTSPTRRPTTSPSTLAPTTSPSRSPTRRPSVSPTRSPSKSPTTQSPTSSPSTPIPTRSPSLSPTTSPSTLSPTREPTASPTTLFPTTSPTRRPTNSPSTTPTASPSGPPTLEPTTSPTEESGDPWCDLGARTDEFCCSATCGTSCFDAEECNEDSPAECCPGAEQGIALFESRTCNDVSAPCIIDEAFLDPDNRAIDDFPKTQEAVDDDDDLTLFVAIGIASVGIAMLSAVGIYKRKSIASVFTGSPTQSVKGASGDVESPQDRFDAEVEYRNVTAAYQTSSANDSPGFSPKGPSLPSPQFGFSKAWDSTFDTKSETTTKLERAMSFAMDSASNRPLQRTPSSNPPTNNTTSNSKPGLMRKTSSTFGSMMSAMLRVATSEEAQTSKVPTQKKKMTTNKSSKELAQEVRRVFDSNNTPTQQPRQPAFGNTSPFTSQHPKPPTSFQKASSFSPTSNSNTFVPPKPSMAKAQSARPPKPTWKPAKPETSSVRPPPGMGFNAHAPLAPASRNVGGGFSQRKPAPPAPKPGMHSRGESTGSSFNDVLAKWKGDEGNQGHSRNSSGLTPTRAKAPASGSSHRRMPSGGYITAKGSASTRNPQFEGSSNSNQFGRKLLNVASSTGQRVSRSFSRTSSASDRSSGSYVEPMTSIQQRRKLFEKRGQSETVRGTTVQQQSTTENAANLYSRNNLRPTGARTGYKR